MEQEQQKGFVSGQKSEKAVKKNGKNMEKGACIYALFLYDTKGETENRNSLYDCIL